LTRAALTFSTGSKSRGITPLKAAKIIQKIGLSSMVFWRKREYISVTESDTPLVLPGLTSGIRPYPMGISQGKLY
jgi:hypothetical protein